ncbi:MAG TPA: hypothetical protein VHT73_13535 [Thermodesulfobacteriota bacterium]|nr:hypothetical protein [Thermodesulfobacteriota bacterium]
MNIEKRLGRLEEALKSHWVTWRTRDGKEVRCDPVQLFTARPGDALHTQILDADPASFRGCPLVGFVRAFLMSEPDQEMKKDFQVVEMLTDLGIPFHWDRKGENEKF